MVNSYGVNLFRLFYPPDKSGGYAQKTLTELHGFNQYLIYKVK